MEISNVKNSINRIEENVTVGCLTLKTNNGIIISISEDKYGVHLTRLDKFGQLSPFNISNGNTIDFYC